MPPLLPNVVDPLKFAKKLWPDVYFYKQQREVIYSVVDNDETYVPAGNQLGKDFVAAFICLWFFLSRNPCRIVTTSAKDDHLRVLWGEINRFVTTAALPLDYRKGGPLMVNHQDIRKVVHGDRDPISYLVGMVAGPGSEAAMQGHHANPTDVRLANDGVPRTLFVADECSSVETVYHRMAKTWRKRGLYIGNTWPCDNFWKEDCQRGDVPRDDDATGESGYYRKIIKITAEDSPNVRLARAQIAAGKEPTGEIIVPGVKGWADLQRDEAIYNEIEKAVSLHAIFYEGAGVKMYPVEWLSHAIKKALALRRSATRRVAKAVGIDPAEGGDMTTMCAGDEFGLMDLVSQKTPDTNELVGQAISFMTRHGLTPHTAERAMIDQGGGGKQLADRLRSKGWGVQTVPFGAGVTTELKRGKTLFDERFEVLEERYTFKNRRAQLFGEARALLDPTNEGGYALPEDLGRRVTLPGRKSLFDQLRAIPLTYDEEGRLNVPPKQKKTRDDKQVTLDQLVGHSPDELDAFVLMVHGLLYERVGVEAGAAW